MYTHMRHEFLISSFSLAVIDFELEAITKDLGQPANIRRLLPLKHQLSALESEAKEVLYGCVVYVCMYVHIHGHICLQA